MKLTATQLEAFDRFWKKLHEENRHLDAALADLSPNVKAWLAEIAPMILLRPVSLCEALGIGVKPGEPWTLSPSQLAHWRPARLLVERLADSDRPRLMRDTRPLPDDYPPALIRAWTQDFGAEVTASLVRELAQLPPRGLRFRTSKERDQFIKDYGEKLPFPLKPSALSPLGAQLGGYAEVMRSPEFENGSLELQDEGSQRMSFFALAPEEFKLGLRAEPGAWTGPATPAATWPPVASQARLIDACAGAGGKSLAWSAIGQNHGRIFAYDVSETKLQALRRRAKRGGFTNIQAHCIPERGEAAAQLEFLKPFAQTADRVLVDAPCSGWGVLRRNPDLKWRDVNEPLQRLEALQARLLDVFATLVKVGGVLTYGVCTFRKEETTRQVEAFLASHSEFEAIAGGYVGPGPSDGFFMQAMRRKPS